MFKSPAFQCYPAELLNDEAVKLMNNREFGVYWKLICHNWTEKSIPSSEDALAFLVREDPKDFALMWPKMASKFRKKGNRLLNKRVEKERAKQRKFSMEQSMRAKKQWTVKMAESRKRSAVPSRPSHSRNNGLPSPAQELSSSSSSSSLKTTTTDIVQVGSSPTIPPLPDISKPYLIDTTLKKVVCGWKVVTGYEKDDRVWDRANWARTAKSAKVILDFFADDWKSAVNCCEEIRQEMTKNKLTCTIETVVKHMADWKIKNCKPLEV